MRYLARVTFVCMALTLVGCVASGIKPEVVDRNQQSAPGSHIPTPPVTPTPLPVDGEIKPPPVALPITQATAAPVAVPAAVTGLIKQAEQKEAEGDLTMASASLERALRIAPNSAEVYYRLARVHQAQGQHDQAVQFARRGLAQGADSELQAKLQAIIAGNQ